MFDLSRLAYIYYLFLGGGGGGGGVKSQIIHVNVGFKHLLKPHFNSKHCEFSPSKIPISSLTNSY